jgi:Ni/Fe-hydrogenase subunit HybB-like protein
MWQGNSVLFEVGMCVMCYLTVLYIEFLPVVCDRLEGDLRFPALARVCAYLNRKLDRVMFVFIIAGVVLSCLHQSSLGNLMVIAESKWHDLWDTPISSLLFLLSAFMVGFPMVIFESMYASWSFKLEPEMEILSPLAKYVVFFTGLYLAFKVGDVLVRESYVLLAEWSAQSICFIIEMVFGLIVPFVMLLSARVRRTPKLLFIAALLIVLGVAFNRVNVFLVAYQPPYATKTYFPAFSEIAVTVGLISLLILVYRVIVTYLPVISQPDKARIA